MDVSGWNPSLGKDRASISRSPHSSRRHVLLVEDNKADIFLFREAMEMAEVDAEVHVVHDGHAATQFFDDADADPEAPRPDVVLLDLNLPKKTGDDVLRHLRESTNCHDARVVVVTSSDAERDRETMEHLGISDYFRKPSDYAAFLRIGPIVKALLG